MSDLTPAETGTARTFVPLATTDQWLRCSHENTALDPGAEVIMLAPRQVTFAPVRWQTATSPPRPEGLAFDGRGCLYHGDAARFQVQRVAWQPVNLATTGSDPDPAVDLLAPPVDTTTAAVGGFHPVASAPELVLTPRALAADPDEHLFVLDAATGRIHVLDLADGHLVRTIELGLPAALPAVDLAADGRTILVATADRARPVIEVTALGLPSVMVLTPSASALLHALPPAFEPTRVAVGPRGERWLLLRERLHPGADGLGDSAWAAPLSDDRRSALLEVPGATDLELDGDGRLVVAGPPDGLLGRFQFSREVDTVESPLRARHYDGRGLVRTPDGAIGFWMRDVPVGVSGFRLAVVARETLVPQGRVDCFQLDGGAYQQNWGRCFVEACIPEGASVRLAFVTADDEPDPATDEGASIPRFLPSNLSPDTQNLPPAFPALVARSRLPQLEEASWVLHRRSTGSEVPWVTRHPDDPFEVYEVPVIAPPGRYLWIRLLLAGTTAVTPRIRAVRVEVPGHDLLDRLPRVYRSDPDSASFLDRYLALGDGLLTDMEGRAARRDLMLDPWGAPAAVLPWLASLVGLTLDERWPERARRTMFAEAVRLFRLRGTVAGLRRMLEIYLESPVIIIEDYRFRGLGGAFAGDPDATTGTAVVGYGYRVGGADGPEGMADAYTLHAHRFSVLVTRDLDEEQLAAVQTLLDLHRPAHTLVEVCTVGRGMRVGIGLHVAVSTLVGPSAGFHPSVVGTIVLGAESVLGKPRAGVRSDGSRLGVDTLVDP